MHGEAWYRYVRVNALRQEQVPLGIPHNGLGCFDHDPGGDNRHIWVIPGRKEEPRRFFRAVTGNSVTDEVPHRGSREDLLGVVLVDHQTELVVFHPKHLNA